MFQFTVLKKIGSSLQRNTYSFRLEQSLLELVKAYDLAGGPAADIRAEFDRKTERCLVDTAGLRSGAQDHLHMLLRALAIHQYVTEEPELVGLKLKVLENVLFFGELNERWAAIRALLAARLDLICGLPFSGLAGHLEIYKQAWSLPTSPLGKLLVATALFNFDRVEEQPPANLTLQFLKGRFPEHRWEIRAGDGASLALQNQGSWCPENPLCRWEYLAADLAHVVFRRQRWLVAPGQLAGEGALAVQAGVHAAAGGQGGAETTVRVFCRFEGSDRSDAKVEQMELFPLKPDTLPVELQRRIHRRLGAEGVRQFAFLMAVLADSPRGEALHLSLLEVACRNDPPALGARKRQEHAEKLRAVIGELAEVELSRLTTAGGRTSREISRLVVVLGQRDVASAEDAFPVGSPDGEEAGGQSLRLLVDSYFHDAAPGSLASPYRELPEELLAASAKEHPLALALFAYLRAAWAKKGDSAVYAVSGSVKQIFGEAGLWFNERSRYRTIETFKRELTFLQEAGFLGAWRMSRSGSRDALDDTYRLEAPHRPAERARGQGGEIGTTMVSA